MKGRVRFATVLIASVLFHPAAAEEPVTSLQRGPDGQWDLEQVSAFRRDTANLTEVQISVQLALSPPEFAQSGEEATRLCRQADAVVTNLETSLGPHLLRHAAQKWRASRIRTYVVTPAGIDSLLANEDVEALMRWMEAYGGFTESYVRGRDRGASSLAEDESRSPDDSLSCRNIDRTESEGTRLP